MLSFEYLLFTKHFVNTIHKYLQSPVNQAGLIMGYCVQWITEL